MLTTAESTADQTLTLLQAQPPLLKKGNHTEDRADSETVADSDGAAEPFELQHEVTSGTANVVPQPGSSTAKADITTGHTVTQTLYPVPLQEGAQQAGVMQMLTSSGTPPAVAQLAATRIAAAPQQAAGRSDGRGLLVGSQEPLQQADAAAVAGSPHGKTARQHQTSTARLSQPLDAANASIDQAPILLANDDVMHQPAGSDGQQATEVTKGMMHMTEMTQGMMRVTEMTQGMMHVEATEAADQLPLSYPATVIATMPCAVPAWLGQSQRTAASTWVPTQLAHSQAAHMGHSLTAPTAATAATAATASLPGQTLIAATAATTAKAVNALHAGQVPTAPTGATPAAAATAISAVPKAMQSSATNDSLTGMPLASTSKAQELTSVAGGKTHLSGKQKQRAAEASHSGGFKAIAVADQQVGCDSTAVHQPEVPTFVDQAEKERVAQGTHERSPVSKSQAHVPGKTVADRGKRSAEGSPVVSGTARVTHKRARSESSPVNSACVQQQELSRQQGQREEAQRMGPSDADIQVSSHAFGRAL